MKGSAPPLSIRVNPVGCVGHGLCANWLPERVELDEWGYPIANPTPLSPDLIKLAHRAAAECPVRALLITALPVAGAARRPPTG
jgi:ferredoxin